MGISLIWAQDTDGGIGRAGALPWHLPEDMQRFRVLTTGATVVMGRRTWESLPDRFRPLPDRRNVVVTRDPAYDAPGAEVTASLKEALGDGDAWVIGGAQVYAAAMPQADRLFVTEVDGHFDGDVHAPAIDAQWHEVDRDPPTGWHTSSNGLHYRFRELRRG